MVKERKERDSMHEKCRLCTTDFTCFLSTFSFLARRPHLIHAPHEIHSLRVTLVFFSYFFILSCALFSTLVPTAAHADYFFTAFFLRFSYIMADKKKSAGMWVGEKKKWVRNDSNASVRFILILYCGGEWMVVSGGRMCRCAHIRRWFIHHKLLTWSALSKNLIL